MPKIKIRTIIDINHTYKMLLFCCPGCAQLSNNDGLNSIAVNAKGKYNPSWSWNNMMRNVTLRPSLKVLNRDMICHKFVRNGQIQFLDDCDHSLAGKTIELPDLPEWILGLSKSVKIWTSKKGT